MPTGACGINCDVCRLNVTGVCGSCGPGTSREGMDKSAVQKGLFGRACPILACAIMNNISYCLRDCRSFPCENFHSGSYPFSEAYLNMQERRRKDRPVSKAPYGNQVTVPPEYWEDLKTRDLERLCEDAGAVADPPGKLVVRFLEQDVQVDIEDRCIRLFQEQKWEKTADPFLELMLLVYLINVQPGDPTGVMICVRDLKEAHFFHGPHELKTAPVLSRFERDPDGLRQAAEAVGGTVLEMADTAYRFLPLPKIPLYYLFWKGDEDFPADLSVLFDQTIERHLSADAIWGLVNLVSDALLRM